MQLAFTDVVTIVSDTRTTRDDEHVSCKAHRLLHPLRERLFPIDAENVYLGSDSFCSECGCQRDGFLWWWWWWWWKG